MGERETSEALWLELERHRGILHKVAGAYCRDPADRADLVQEIVAELARAFPRFDPGQRFSTWMYRVALNVAISFHRRELVRARHTAPAAEALLEVVAAPAPDPDREAALARLHRFIHQLPPLDRALMLLYLDGHPHRAIAEVLGLSESNVGTKVGRLKDRLRRELAEEADR